jgi:hypothetical protein
MVLENWLKDLPKLPVVPGKIRLVAMADYITNNRMVNIDLALPNHNIKLPLIKSSQAGMIGKNCKTSKAC